MVSSLICSLALVGQTLPDATTVLNKSIAYHDAEGIWETTSHTFHLRETRPGGQDRLTIIDVNLAKQTFALWQTRKEDTLRYQIMADDVMITLNGAIDISEDKQKEYRLSTERALTIRDYYTYLWGLPMKLRDPGTQVGEEVKGVDFFGQMLLQLKVTYTEAVGKDIWYFYFDPQTYALKGYRFYHDEAANDGEYILLEGEQEVGSLRLPAKRGWYTHGEERYLGSDILEKEK